MQNDPEISSIFSKNLLISFWHNKNIRETLVHSSLQQNCSEPNGTFPCGIGQSKTCSFTDSDTVISAPNSQFSIKHHFTCLSSNLIYCISCNKCGLLYIGESGKSPRARSGEHCKSVNNQDNTKPVVRHFTSVSHCVSDMKIRALCAISGTKNSCKRQEKRLIHRLSTLYPSGINERLSFI